MVGATNAEKEKEYGRLLAPYLADKENLFVVSSDFCHWYHRSAYLTKVGGLDFSIHITTEKTSACLGLRHVRHTHLRLSTKQLRL
jgi:predicted class III extradiol MEMO1 family dioxygenase